MNERDYIWSAAINAAHGSESPPHYRMKPEWREFLWRVNFELVFFERGGDLIAVKKLNGSHFTVAIENEFSTRNLLSNIHRNLEVSGCNGEIISCPDFATAASVCRKLSRELPSELHSKIGVTTISMLRLLFPEVSQDQLKEL